MSLPRRDTALEQARRLIAQAQADPGLRPQVRGFFDPDTCTVSYVVSDPARTACAVIDSVLDFDPCSGRACTASADAMAGYIEAERLPVQWLLETHVHADHLAAAPYLQKKLGGRLAIGREIVQVQEVFGKVFNAGTDFARDGSQFDHLFTDGECLRIGELQAVALHVPGHTPACLAYVIGDAVFPGDTLFMPDYGTARCDFPGGDAQALYRSIQRLLRLPGQTRVFLCHDYKAPGRDQYAWETTIGAERAGNVHLGPGIGEAEFVSLRTRRDAALPAPRLLLPSTQVNMRGGRLPAPEDNGVRYLKLPIAL